MERLRGCPAVALDTEGDSLHHYPERLALVQVAEPDGGAWLLDPLAVDLAPLGALLAGPRPLLILHAGDNDLDHLKRRYGMTVGALFDTSIAARFLGVRALGLDVLLQEFLGVTLPPSRQKDDWSARPLTPVQEAYAIADVIHLFALADRLGQELDRVGRRAWAEEECAALAAEPPAERVADPEAWARLKGARDLEPRHRAVLRSLWQLRERLARGADRPPFKILGDDTLVAVARRAPTTVAELRTVPGCTPRVVGRWGEAVVEAVAGALGLRPDEWPALTERPRPPSLPGVVRRRIEALRRWRATAAQAAGLDPGLLLPNRLIRAIAEAAPAGPEALARVEGVRRWRVEAYGASILAAMRAA